MCTVLVIDDEQTIVNLLQMALTKLGYNVETASDGREGIQKFDKKFIDIVITDICMPNIDGKKVAQHIRNSSRKTTPVVAISGTPWLLEDRDFDKILAKPFQLKALHDIIEHLANKPHKLTENRFLRFEPERVFPSITN
ncbi:MAG: response regulator [Deltaproteobacteria bacterium]|nr:response regulator [Deltaproteobacteria bacterium]